METTIVYWGYIGIMENGMQTTIVCWGYMGITGKKMETTVMMGCIGFRVHPKYKTAGASCCGGSALRVRFQRRCKRYSSTWRQTRFLSHLFADSPNFRLGL